MRKLLLLALILFGYATSAAAQEKIEFQKEYALTAASQTPGSIDLRGASASFFKIEWWAKGTVSAGACAVVGSADNSTFGTTIIAAQTVTASGRVLYFWLPGINYVKVSCTTPIAGSGTVTLTLTVASDVRQAVFQPFASGARTASPTPVQYLNRVGFIWMQCTILVTVSPGGGETLSLRVGDNMPYTPATSIGQYAANTATALTANQFMHLSVGTGITASPDGGSNNVNKANIIPAAFNVYVTHSASGSWTYSVECSIQK